MKKKQLQSIINRSIMLRTQLHQKYNHQQWYQIQSLTPLQFISQQNIILKGLLHYIDTYESVLQVFYHNHQKIYHWWMLSVEHHDHIKQYIFYQLLSRPISYYHPKITHQHLLRFSNDLPHHLQQPTQTLPSIQLSKIIFTNLAQSPSTQQSLKRRLIEMQSKTRIDFHDLYMRTFNACDGHRYVLYNFQKHMKGSYQRDKYNHYIRRRHKTQQYAQQHPLQYINRSIIKPIQNQSKTIQFRTNRIKVMKKVKNKAGSINYRLKSR